jgi:hypothetical protein
VAAEHELVPIDHARIARALFRAWKFPAAIADAVGYHHQPARTNHHVQLAALTHLADSAAYELDLADPVSAPPELVGPEVLRLLDVELPLPPEVEQEIRAEVERSLGILELLDLD